jgi:hypothetical protein
VARFHPADFGHVDVQQDDINRPVAHIASASTAFGATSTAYPLVFREAARSPKVDWAFANCGRKHVDKIDVANNCLVIASSVCARRHGKGVKAALVAAVLIDS